MKAADCFNKLFCSIGKKIISAIEIPIDKVNISPANNPISIYIFDYTYTEAFNFNLQNPDLNKETGFDRVTANVLKLYANILSYPVPNLVSLSFTKKISGCVKHAKVCPVYKVGSKRKVDNY